MQRWAAAPTQPLAGPVAAILVSLGITLSSYAQKRMDAWTTLVMDVSLQKLAAVRILSPQGQASDASARQGTSGTLQ
jgi:hypothetical protein